VEAGPAEFLVQPRRKRNHFSKTSNCGIRNDLPLINSKTKAAHSGEMVAFSHR